MPKPQAAAHRILLIDDNASIHGDFRKVLGATPRARRRPRSRCWRRTCSAMRTRVVAPELRDRFRVSRTGRRGDGAPGRGRVALCHGVRRHAHAAGLGRPEDHRAPVGGGSGRAGGHLLGAHRLRLVRGRATDSATPTSCWCCASRPNPSRFCNAPRRSPASGRTSGWCASRWSASNR